MVPSRVKTAPRPELKSGLFSRAVTALVAISRAVADGSWVRRAEWERRISRRAVRWVPQREGGRLERVMAPAPPWSIMRGWVEGGFDGEAWKVDIVGFGVWELWSCNGVRFDVLVGLFLGLVLLIVSRLVCSGVDM